MIIRTSGMMDEETRIPLTVDLSTVRYVQIDGKNCVLFYTPDIGGSGLFAAFAPRPMTNSVPTQDIRPFLNKDDWFEVTQIYSNRLDGVPCYIRLQDIYSYTIFPPEDGYDMKTVGLWGAFGAMRIRMESLQAVQAEFERRDS